MSKSTRTKQWPRIYKQFNRSGQPTYYVDLRAVNGGRPGFPTSEEAQTRAEQARIQRDNEGAAAFALSLDVRVDAAKAHEILSPHGVSILDVAKYYEKHVLAYKSAPIIKDVVERYIADSVKRNLRPRTVEDLKHRLNTFAVDFGESRLSEVSLDELKEWVMDDGWEPRTRINSLTKISQLYGYAIRNKWADSNLAANIDRPMVDETTPEIYTVEHAEKLLKHANKFGLLPYIAIGFFAGVRSAELMRMTAKNINFETKTIVVGADAAKKRSQRMIEISDTLLAWLEVCKGELQNGERLIEANKLRKAKPLLLEAAGIENWPANGLRHSFGSYHLAMFQNIEKTANQMGNSAAVIHNHYKALVTKDAAEKFWSLRPENNGNVG
jgi:integrase